MSRDYKGLAETTLRLLAMFEDEASRIDFLAGELEKLHLGVAAFQPPTIVEGGALSDEAQGLADAAHKPEQGGIV